MPIITGIPGIFRGISGELFIMKKTIDQSKIFNLEHQNSHFETLYNETNGQDDRY